MESIVNNLHNITNLEICEGLFGDDGVLQIVGSLRSITFLDIRKQIDDSGNNGLTPRVISAISSNLPQLGKLYLSTKSNMQRKTVSGMREHTLSLAGLAR